MLQGVRNWIISRELERELKRISDGKEGPAMKQVWDWAVRNKKTIGLYLAGVVAFLGTIGLQDPNAHWAIEGAKWLGYVVTYLVGRGMPSDAEARDAQGK